MQEEKENGEIQINLGEILRYVLKKWWIVLIALIVSLALGVVVGKVQKKTVYKSEATYVVSYSAGNNTSETNTGISITQTVIQNSVEILKRDSFYTETLKRIGEEEVKKYDLTVKKLKEYITISCTDSASKLTLIYVTVLTEDPVLSYEIIKAIADEYTNEANEKTTFISEYVKGKYALADGKMEFSQIDELGQAKNPEPDSSVLKWTAICGMAGLVVCVVVLGAIVVLDTRVKGVEDLTEKYNAATLGTIPDLSDKGLYKSKKYGNYNYYGYSYGGKKKDKGEKK